MKFWILVSVFVVIPLWMACYIPVFKKWAKHDRKEIDVQQNLKRNFRFIDLGHKKVPGLRTDVLIKQSEEQTRSLKQIGEW